MNIQERLYEAFVSRELGVLSGDTLLGMLACILRGAPHRFVGVRLRGCNDLRALTDEQAEKALEILPTLDIRRDPDAAPRLLAAET